MLLVESCRIIVSQILLDCQTVYPVKKTCDNRLVIFVSGRRWPSFGIESTIWRSAAGAMTQVVSRESWDVLHSSAEAVVRQFGGFRSVGIM